MPTAPIQVFDIDANRLDPAFDPEHAHELGANLAASLTWPRGQVLAEDPAVPGTFVKYAEVAEEAAGAAPVLTTPVGGDLPAGDYTVRYRFVNLYGQYNAASASAVTTAALNDKVHVGAVVLPTGAVSVNWYVSLTAGDAADLRLVLNNDGSAADLPTAEAGDEEMPATATFTWMEPGTYPAKRILRYACTTDASKLITIGGSGDSDPIVSQPDIDTFISGIFKSEELTGMTIQALSDLGGIILSGDLDEGLIKF